jgi:F420-dependent oxidoreductase-like protein
MHSAFLPRKPVLRPSRTCPDRSCGDDGGLENGPVEDQINRQDGALSMKFGIHNPSWVYGPDPAAAFEGVKAKVQWAENHGFVWFSVLDHLIQIGGIGAPDEPFLEGWTVLAALAAVTSRIRLATLATAVGYRNPTHLAKIAASVDLISRGRLTLGIGAGWFEDEYRQYGWDFPSRPAIRIRQMEEAVRLILAMWTQPRTTFHGRYFHAEEAILEPKPVRKPHPPVLIAGGGEQLTLRAVARLADACNVGGDPDTVRHKLAVLRRHCDAARRDYDAIEKTIIINLSIARDDAGVQAKCERLGPSGDFVGTISEAVDLIGRYQEAGVQLLINSDYRNDMETHELMAAEVMPHFA